MGALEAVRAALSAAPRAQAEARLPLALQARRVASMLNEAWSDAGGPSPRVLSCKLRRVHPRSGGSFLVEYEATMIDGGECRAETLLGEIVDDAIEDYRAGVVQSLSKRRRSQLDKGDRGARIVALPDIGMLVRPQGLDERLPGLGLLHDADARRALMDAHGLPGAGGAVSVRLLGHRLGRRCIARLRRDGEDASAIVKLYKARSPRPARVAASMQALWDAGLDRHAEVRVPRLLACDPQRQLLLMEDVPGLPLAWIEPAGIPDALATAGRGIARLHASALPLAQTHTAQDEMAIVDRWVALVGRLVPAWRPRLDAAREVVARRFALAPPCEPAPVHRDFYEKQVLVCDGSMAIIDFDTLCMADPALDVGNFVAHLRLGEQGLGAPAATLERAFLRGYGRGGGAGFDLRVHAYVGSSLLRLACINGIRPEGRPDALALLDGL